MILLSLPIFFRFDIIYSYLHPSKKTMLQLRLFLSVVCLFARLQKKNYFTCFNENNSENITWLKWEAMRWSEVVWMTVCNISSFTGTFYLPFILRTMAEVCSLQLSFQYWFESMYKSTVNICSSAIKLDWGNVSWIRY